MTDKLETITGNRGLQLEQPLIFEQDAPGRLGVDLGEPQTSETHLGGVERKDAIGLPNLSE
ncbi:MAG: aminomethyl-transferring glycine dehydrogenase subunit GcvPB, partial [Rhodospirillaceae bacterium]|nr:aminomethyl-transferring glycine dehydrogenase subunit GcvPB [Rhodospirillaceae bacterium]